MLYVGRMGSHTQQIDVGNVPQQQERGNPAMSINPSRDLPSQLLPHLPSLFSKHHRIQTRNNKASRKNLFTSLYNLLFTMMMGMA